MSIVNTLLQYCLLVTIFYVYAKVPMLGGNQAKKLGHFGRPNFSRVLAGAEQTKKVKGGTETPLEEQPSDHEQQQQTSTPPSKRKPFKRSSPSRTNIHEQNRASGSPTSASTHNTLVLGRRLVIRSSSSTSQPSSSSEKDDASLPSPPSPVEESHRRFLKEAFCNVPMMEIDRKIKAANWDLNEAAALLAQEDYTWQPVLRRRSIHILEATAT